MVNSQKNIKSLWDKFYLDFKMSIEETLEFNTLLLLETANRQNEDLEQYIEHKYNTHAINKRYKILLDKFLNQYALN